MNWFDVLSLTALGAAFLSTFLRGFQNKNVASNLVGYAFVTGIAMNAADVVLITTIATSGIKVLAWSAIGAGFGYVAAMKVHDFLLRNKEHERAKAARRDVKDIARKVARGVIFANIVKIHRRSDTIDSPELYEWFLAIDGVKMKPIILGITPDLPVPLRFDSLQGPFSLAQAKTKLGVVPRFGGYYVVRKNDKPSKKEGKP